MNAVNKPASADVKSCILVHAVKGCVVHSFMTAQEGRDAYAGIVRDHSGGSIFETEPADDAKLIYDVSPNLRNRVEAAKVSLRKQLEWQSALDKQNVTTDPQLRNAIYRAIQDIQNQSFALGIHGDRRTIR